MVKLKFVEARLVEKKLVLVALVVVEFPVMRRLPVIFVLPFTLSLYTPGSVVPIATLPVPVIRILSVLLVPKIKGALLSV